ncbi:hypothetical protein LOTGIDRAFT_225111 [Lottia gigantea]|uniref:Uncharacterized protein n=1 Tax=Lottia gigantea TaxID=225164 RepID=V4ACS6_LOTGI|nr:hypothetical protein LOTGIDRAFT_225111 [Lottia gigantea]ESP01819.1 hypothetical protein LOTGIDRAFT_225111 [Lottia gigantea]
MSMVHGSSFQIAQDVDSENQGVHRVKKGGLTAKNGHVAVPKRAALGTITNQIRVQPSRAAKSNQCEPQDENSFAKQKTFGGLNDQGFKIYLDENVKPSTTSVQPKSTSNIAEHVTSLPLQALEEIQVDHETGSPMVLDVTIEELIEKKPLDREAIILTVPEYAEDIYNHLREAELRHRSKPGYMKKQPDITSSMRSILVDWMVEVSEEYKLHRETLFLSINYIDRFLSQMSVLRGKLQLVGAASMFIASKYEEIYPPEVSEFVYITDDTYEQKQVLRMEHLILKVLNFDVAQPTINWFTDTYAKMAECDDTTKSLSMYLSELTLVDADPYLKYLSSTIAAASLCLANITMGNEPWPSSLAKETKYEVSDFSDCLQELYQTFINAPNHPQQAIREKYRSSKYQQVSSLSPPSSLSFM